MQKIILLLLLLLPLLLLPQFILKPRPFYQKMTTDSISIPCSAEGSPKPTITWRKIECPLKPAYSSSPSSSSSFSLPNANFPGAPSDASPCHMPRGRTHNWDKGNLTITALKLEDGGVYECVLRSAVMTLTARTKLFVETMQR